MTKYRLLGSAVLIYAFVTSGALLSLASGWPEGANSILWLLYALGGIGLIRGSEWGRVLTLFATSGSLVAMFVLPIDAEGTEFAYISTVWFLFGIPAALLFVWAMLIGLPGLFKDVEVARPPETTADSGRSKHKKQNIAYISFLVLGMISLWTSYIVGSEIQAAGGNTGGIPGVLGFLVIIPFGIPLLVALTLGPGISLFQVDDFRLIALTLLSIGLVMLLAVFGYETWPILLSTYGAICTATGLLWFTRHQKQS